MRRIFPFVLVAALAAAFGCDTGVPEGIQPVSGFDIERYLGKWYEIARLDHSFERGLSNVTAEYSLRESGEVIVLNRGYDTSKKKWKEARGRARFLGSPDVASLRVSFFGPFWGGYHVVALDSTDYSWAIVSGPKRSYLWILSRKPTMEPELLSDLVGRARRLGFETEKLIYVDQIPAQ